MDDMEEAEKTMNSVKLKLIDFGVSTRYLRIDQAGRECHTQFRHTSNFYGNYAYASPTAHSKHVLTRRDDLYCLVYFLSHLLTNELLFFSDPESQAYSTTVEYAAKCKNEKKPAEFLTGKRNQCLIQAADYIWSLGFEEKPDYNRVRFLFTKNLLDQNQAPSLMYDWNLDAHREITNDIRGKKCQGVEQSVQIEEQSIDIKELAEDQVDAVTNMVRCSDRNFKCLSSIKENS